MKLAPLLKAASGGRMWYSSVQEAHRNCGAEGKAPHPAAGALLGLPRCRLRFWRAAALPS